MQTTTRDPVESPSPNEGPDTERGSPFHQATSLPKRLKLFLWGDSGVGKTTLSLQFPAPVLIDLEGGADSYGDAFDFHVLRASTADEVSEAVRWLLANEHPYRTLILDPITVYWDALQKKWSDIFLRRNKGSKGHRFEFYDLQPRDWMTIKAEFKELIRLLIALDMNVIVTARQKVQYADDGFMKAIGETFDGEKSLPYLFDTIVRLSRDEQARFMASCLKDRTNRLPAEPFESSYAVFEQAFGTETLSREAHPITSVSVEQLEQLRTCIDALGLTSAHVTKRLAAYGATRLDDLKPDTARTILTKLETALARRGESTTKES